jgi:hypothetical protein
MGPKSNSASRCFWGARLDPEGFRRLKVEAEASAYQLLTHLLMAVADVKSDIIEEFVLNECAHLARPVIIGAGDNLPCQ